MNGIDLDLRDNVNLWGAPPSAARTLASAAAGAWRYPDVGAEELSAAIAIDAGVAPDEVVAGCGSDDIIDSFLRAVTAPGDVVAYPEPTFRMVPAFARLNRLRTVGVPLRPDGSADVDGLLAVGAAVTYVATPNNPTGTVTSARDLQRLVDGASGALLIDEAYAEFADAGDWRGVAPARTRMLVTRTFSKAWGLAGLRVGYGIGNAALVRTVADARGPYKVNAFASAAAVAALREDGGWMRAAAREAGAARATLARALGRRPAVRTWESRGNFAFAAVPRPATDIARAFAERGIGIRAFRDLPGIGDAIRIGVAPEPSLSRVVHAIEEVLS
jgi:histidinol-phosphate aminotransferase